MTDTTKLLERIQQLEADCIAYANDLTILEEENEQLHRILDALREPSVPIQATAFRAFEAHDDMEAALVAAVAAAEQEVDRG